jgi:hypothetical protein
MYVKSTLKGKCMFKFTSKLLFGASAVCYLLSLNAMAMDEEDPEHARSLARLASAMPGPGSF